MVESAETTSACGRRPSARPAAPTSLRRHHEPTQPLAHGQRQEGGQRQLLAAAEGLRDLRRRPDAAEVPDGAHAAALHGVPDEGGLRHRRHGGHGDDVPRRLRHPRLRRRLHALLLRRQVAEAPQRRHHARLLRQVPVPGGAARSADAGHAVDLQPAHGRRRLHDLLRHRHRHAVLHQPQRPAVHAHAPGAPAVDLHHVHHRARAHPGAAWRSSSWPSSTGAPPATSAPTSSRRSSSTSPRCRSTPRGCASSGTGR